MRKRTKKPSVVCSSEDITLLLKNRFKQVDSSKSTHKLTKKSLFHVSQAPLHEGGLLQQEFIPTTNDLDPSTTTFSYIHTGQEETWKPSPPLPSLEEISTNSNHEKISIILAYGTSKAREKMSNALMPFRKSENKSLLQTIDNYNSCIGLEAEKIDFCGLISLLDKTQKKTLLADLNEEKISETITEDIEASTTPKSEEEITQLKNKQRETALKWADYLVENRQRFLPIRKLSAKRFIPFVVKNTSPRSLPLNSTFRKYFYQPLKEKNLEDLNLKLGPIFSLLNDIERNDKKKLISDYYMLLDTDQQKLLDDICNTFFFRQTSKLGLSFAKSIGASILFDWTSVGARSAQEIDHQLDKRPNKNNPPEFQIYKNEPSHETITNSERRELGRLQEKSEAPNYLPVP